MERRATLCWSCKNCGLCSWCKDSVPIKDWDAIPTHFDKYDSYIVVQCPQFNPKDKLPTTIEEISKIVSKSIRMVFRYLETRAKTFRLRELLREKGYTLHICKEIDDEENSLRYFYLEKVGK